MNIKDIKKNFFALRNGMLADALRKQCAAPHRTIFGLNLPQIREIALEAAPDDALAEALWADAACRESRLLAPMLSSPLAERLNWLAEVLTVEEADVLCHRLLRRVPGAKTKAFEAAKSPEPMQRYAALRLLMNLMPLDPAEIRPLLEGVPEHPLTAGVLRQINMELDELSL